MRRFGLVLASLLLAAIAGAMPACADDDYGQGFDAGKAADLSIEDVGEAADGMPEPVDAADSD
jgi:hypothetical protein